MIFHLFGIQEFTKITLSLLSATSDVSCSLSALSCVVGQLVNLVNINTYKILKSNINI